MVDEWPAMNLISQTLFGTLVTSIFGFSFTALRLSIFLLSFCSSLYLFKVAKKLSGNNEYVAFAFTAAFLVNAVYMHLSMTYMTDVFFIAMLIFAINALVNYNANGKATSYLWFCFWCIMAMLCRQQALIFGFLIAPCVFKQKKNGFLKVVLVLLPVFLCWLASDKYRHHLTANHIGHNIQQMNHLLDYLKEIPIDKIALQAADGLLVLGAFFIPISFFLFFHFVKQLNRKELGLLAITSIVSIAATLKAFGIYPIGNIAELFEIGPRLIKAGGDAINGDWAKALHLLNYTVAVVSLNLLLFFALKRRKEKTALFSNGTSKLIYLSIAFGYLLFISVSNAYFDRYVLPLALLIFLFMLPSLGELKRRTKVVSTGLIFLIYTLSLIENLDYFNWQKKRLAAIRYIYAKGASADEIDGGFEFNGWVKKNNRYPSDKTKSWWWVVDDKHIVSASRIENTRTDTAFVYQRFIPFKKDTVFVLSKEKK